MKDTPRACMYGFKLSTACECKRVEMLVRHTARDIRHKLDKHTFVPHLQPQLHNHDWCKQSLVIKHTKHTQTQPHAPQ